ncbi:orotidine-5'-phosphate decarboxylase [Aliiglaciecola sp. 2_MG-2023]|uniref:orotidine-5'-phosphate decarboxylase n=1 Tax=unclassified Aliiglaciecola TaxID=2593648 RepID=UPI0026E140B9|nr:MULTISPECIES: orotidine-5'-phosphate decarboxylase [unclassified Aliiglaciecola]MDO6712726.1 orotidine-5'-phosphate decarboxylase [Aliiglaciecola sp. 2_MG-2023]MDO6753875.1 orotidine-5'-phosphate decarboxylase [Aliiglaciecola sp. 1_MG-2023]
MSDTRVIVALDFDNRAKALNLVSQLDSNLCKLKIGKEMFTYFGPEFVKELVNRGFDVFLDLKFHDIPNTVGKACLAAADLGVWMLNVHASGGPKMMENAKTQLATLGPDQPKLIAVTVLTSMEQSQLNAIGIKDSPEQQVLRLAKLTKNCGLDGVVCSAQEAPILRSSLDKDFLLVTPGIRPLGSDKGDQQRVMTPPEAILAGVNYMVIGRPITQAADPLRALLDINLSVA